MNIYQSIHGVMEEVGAIGKNRKNQQQGFMYRGVDEVMNALQPAFVKYNIFVVPEVLEQTREERTAKSGGQLIYSILKVKFTFFADDGTSVSATVIGEGMDSADKASNKAMSVAFKYACFQVFCIPTEEMVDPDAETPPQSNRGKVDVKPFHQEQGIKQQPKPDAPPQQLDTPATPNINTQMILRLIEGTSFTLDKVNEWITKRYGKSVPIDDLPPNNFNDLYDHLEDAIKKERGNG